MDAILMSLMAAMNEHLLINVYQRDTEDFYTGMVEVLGHEAVILSTYNDAGIADGSVLIAFEAIDEVEFSGDDLDNMAFRIEIAEEDHFLTLHGQEHTLSFDPKRPLMFQLATQAHVSQQMVMVMVADDEAYLEGQVSGVAEDRMTLSVFNKFNYTDVRVIQIDFSDVLVMEFQGLDLKQETALVQDRDALKHVKTMLYQNDGQLKTILDQASQDQTLISIVPKGEMDQFFVGRVKAVNDHVVVLALRDMAAQFGGYLLIRLRHIKNVATASDYLQTIAHYEKWNAAHDFSQQPVLNADREFDPSADLVAGIIEEAAQYERVIRVADRTSDAHYLGYPTQVTRETFVLQTVGDDGDETIPLAFDQIQEIAFGHIYAYLQEAQLKNAGK